ncbi:larval cuticle protein 16/17-like [Palaemon carinicauda]|uniref:larval cuticle protein 16/17-like n=1 Tax=Palaemon carinicauda TaxID=392227 RepID=UPI0035B58B6E
MNEDLVELKVQIEGQLDVYKQRGSNSVHQLLSSEQTVMKVQVLIALCLVALAAARPSDIVDFELDDHEQEQEGQPGRAVEGEYSWVAPDGNEYYIKYVADHNGYRVIEDNVVPVAPDSDLPEADDDDK